MLARQLRPRHGSVRRARHPRELPLYRSDFSRRCQEESDRFGNSPPRFYRRTAG
jgi:hypothetical protein